MSPFPPGKPASPGQPAKHSHHPPQPMVVKDCRPQTLPSSSDQDMQTFLNFGGGVNPMAYKGYTFSKQGRFQFWQSQPQNTHHVPTPITSQVPTRKSANEKKTIPPPQHYFPHSEDQPLSFATFLGPLTPLLYKQSAKLLVFSSLVSPNIYLCWRVFQLSYFLAAICITAIDNLIFVATLPGVALLYSFLSTSIITGTIVQYRNNHHEKDSTHETTKLHGLVATIFQGASHACFFAGVGTLLAVFYGGDNAAQTAASYLQSPSVYLLAVGATLHLVDICLTPIPFRILSTLPLYTLMFLYFIILIRGSTIKQILIGSAIMLGSGFATCFVLHLFARTIFIFVHRNAMGATEFTNQTAEHGGPA